MVRVGAGAGSTAGGAESSVIGVKRLGFVMGEGACLDPIWTKAPLERGDDRLEGDGSPGSGYFRPHFILESRCLVVQRKYVVPRPTSALPAYEADPIQACKHARPLREP